MFIQKNTTCGNAQQQDLPRNPQSDFAIRNSHVPRPSPHPRIATPKYLLHRSKGQAYTRIGGRMYYLGQYGSTESQERYRRVLAEWGAAGVVRRSGSGRMRLPTLTVKELVKQFLDWAKRYYVIDGVASSGLGALVAGTLPLLDLYSSLPAAEFGPIALRAVRQRMIEQGLCRNTINKRIGSVKRVFRWAVGEELISADCLQAFAAVEPLSRGRYGVRETAPVRPASDTAVGAVLPFLPPTISVMVQVQRLTGTRSGELCQMRTCDLNRSKAIWVYQPASHKTAYRGHGRMIHVGPKAQELLAGYLRDDAPETFIFSPMRANAERSALRKKQSLDGNLHDDWVGRYNARSYRRAISYAIESAIAAGALNRADRWFPHQLRHRYATEVRQRSGLEAARVLLGHRNQSQTVEYAEADQSLAAEVAAELG